MVGRSEKMPFVMPLSRDMRLVLDLYIAITWGQVLEHSFVHLYNDQRLQLHLDYCP